MINAAKVEIYNRQLTTLQSELSALRKELEEYKAGEAAVKKGSDAKL